MGKWLDGKVVIVRIAKEASRRKECVQYSQILQGFNYSEKDLDTEA